MFRTFLRPVKMFSMFNDKMHVTRWHVGGRKKERKIEGAGGVMDKTERITVMIAAHNRRIASSAGRVVLGVGRLFVVVVM